MSPAADQSQQNTGDEYDWVRIQAKIERTEVAPVGTNRLLNLCLTNPFVPIGCVCTVAALATGLYNFQKGNSKRQQLMMRARVGAQGFTVCALVSGLFYQAFK